MTDYLDRIEAAARAATQGPWRTSSSGTGIQHSEGNVGYAQFRMNAAYIATANPQTVLWLCRLVRRAVDPMEGSLVAGETPEEAEARCAQWFQSLKAGPERSRDDV